MKLDRTTYEAWLLDRIEGNLTPEQERELSAFLAANPDLEVPGGGLPEVLEEETSIDWKNELRKAFPPAGDADAARLDDFLVARVEKDLTPEQETSLDRFLYEHPEREQDARRIAASRADSERVPFDHKASVERHFPPQGLPDKHRLTDFLIAAQEGDLSREQRSALDRYLVAHPEAAREAGLVAAARVTVDPVVFTGKDRLKKKEGRVITLWLRYAAAASIALLIGLAWWMNNDSSADQVADQEKVKSVAPTSPGSAGTDPAPQGTDPGTPHPENSDPHVLPIPHTRSEGGTTDGRDGDRMEAPRPQPTPQPMRMEEPPPAPQPQLENAPVPPLEEPKSTPLLAQQTIPAVQQDQREQPDAQVPDALVATIDRPEDGGTPVGTVLANAVRGSVIDAGKRDASLDGEDALAMVNKGLGAVTGGQGRVQVDRQSDRDRWKLRLGRNFAISASTGR